MSKHVAVYIIQWCDIHTVMILIDYLFRFNPKQFCLPSFLAQTSSGFSLNSGAFRSLDTF